MKIVDSLKGLLFMVLSTRVFYPKVILGNKRVAVIGPADSAFLEEKGNYIDNFDYIIRLNKAVLTLTPEKSKYIGSRTDILFHSFFENGVSGGGVIDPELFNSRGLKYLINPHVTLKGLRTHYGYFKRNLKKNKTFFLPLSCYKVMTVNFGKWIPTVGYTALSTVLNAGCSEIYITGFTFFKTPYADNYRDHVKDIEKNMQFIQLQGLHNPDLELNEFIKQLDHFKKIGVNVILDSSLTSIVNNQKRNGYEE